MALFSGDKNVRNCSSVQGSEQGDDVVFAQDASAACETRLQADVVNSSHTHEFIGADPAFAPSSLGMQLQGPRNRGYE